MSFANGIDPPPAAPDLPASPAQQPADPPHDPPLGAPSGAVLIGATLGPGTEGIEEDLIAADIDTLRVNAPDRDLERLTQDIVEVEAAENTAGRYVDLMVDLEDPGKVRLGAIRDGSIELPAQRIVALDPRVDQPGTGERIGITNFYELVSGPRRLRPGDILELGGARAEVRSVGAGDIELQIVSEGYVGSDEIVRSLRDRGLPTPGLDRRGLRARGRCDHCRRRLDRALGG